MPPLFDIFLPLRVVFLPVNVVVFVVCPNTRREVAKMNETSGKYTYKFTQKGEHTVVYVVYDESGNSAEHRFTVKVS